MTTESAAPAADVTTRCPSSDCRPGSVLLGVVLPNGRVAFAADRIVVDEEFVRIARQGRAPERRFRFSEPCVRGACRQWDGVGCSLIDRVLATVKAQLGRLPDADAADLPICSIRDECRWFHQRGAVACAVCPDVVTDATAKPDDLPPRIAKVRSAAQV